MTRTIPKKYRRKHIRATVDQTPRLILQERDYHIVEAVYLSRFLSRSILVNLFPPGPIPDRLGKAQPTRPKVSGTNLDRRLAKLFHVGYLDRIRLVVGGELIYAVTDDGLFLLKKYFRDRQLPLPIQTHIDNRSLNLSRGQYIEHALMVAKFRASLVAALRLRPTITLKHFNREPKPAYWNVRGEKHRANPDASFVLHHPPKRDGSTRTVFFLECDRGTMPIERDHNDDGKKTDYIWKLRRYAEAYDRGEHRQFPLGEDEPPLANDEPFRVLTVTTSPRRAAAMATACATDSRVPSQCRAFFLFTTEAAYSDRPTNTLAAIWNSPADPSSPKAIIHPPIEKAEKAA